MNVRDVLLEKVEAGEHVLIYDITRRWPGLGTAEYLAERGIYDELKGKIEKEIYFVGDAVAPRLIEQVVLEAEELARRI